mmetsp:Transcript_29320/g.83391  ORF Transcript_29320/g.83391 Transcript_29320/m.83391 type:complete len:219 (-) Transcript_29320:41-697(-)
MSQEEHVAWGNAEVSTSSSAISRTRAPSAPCDVSTSISSSMQPSTSGNPSPANLEDKHAKDHTSAFCSGYRSEPRIGLPRSSSSKSKVPKAEAVQALLVEAGLERYWSQGSRTHTLGGCRPCHYWHTASGCRSGADCNFCHLPHARTTDAKSKRDASRNLAAEISDQYVEKSLELLTSRSPVLQAALQQRLMHQPSGESLAPMRPRPVPPKRSHILSL